ncbi:MAG: aminotransferase class V-fold PLP-dependent enzyme [Candidatus Aminicenantes bacterium]|nr:aminotransferase class V-fold PLP-dependent enzyme [Candidatus Aminicenantes bacterium]
MIDWEKIRSDFPITKNIIYFQSAAMSPLPIPVFNAIQREYRKLLRQGDIHWMNDMEKFRRQCADLAELIHTAGENITFVPNTSSAMSIMAASFKNHIQKPFNIVSMEDEFPASTLGYEYQGVDMRYVQPVEARYPIESILKMTDRNTLAVVTSHVQYATGFRQDLKALGQELKKRRILFIVNATQSFPFFPIDVRAMNIDALTASVHKWGFTGHIGTMFYTSPSFRRKYPPAWAGWMSVMSGEEDFIHTAKNAPFRLHDSAERYILGTFNLQPLLAFQASVDYLKAIGFQNIRNRIMELTDYLINGLNKLKVKIISPVARKKERSAIISFSLGAKNRLCIKTLAKNKISVGERAGNIRASLNIFNNFEDIDRLLEVVKNFC